MQATALSLFIAPEGVRRGLFAVDYCSFLSDRCKCQRISGLLWVPFNVTVILVPRKSYLENATALERPRGMGNQLHELVHSDSYSQWILLIKKKKKKKF